MNFSSRLQTMARFEEKPFMAAHFDMTSWGEQRQEAHRRLINNFLEEHMDALESVPSVQKISESFDYIDLDETLIQELQQRFIKSYGLEGVEIVD